MTTRLHATKEDLALIDETLRNRFRLRYDGKYTDWCGNKCDKLFVGCVNLDRITFYCNAAELVLISWFRPVIYERPGGHWKFMRYRMAIQRETSNTWKKIINARASFSYSLLFLPFSNENESRSFYKQLSNRLIRTFKKSLEVSITFSFLFNINSQHLFKRCCW